MYFIVVGAALPRFGIALTYVTATLLALLASGSWYMGSRIARKNNIGTTPENHCPGAISVSGK